MRVARRSVTVVAAGLVGLVTCAGLMTAWYVVVEAPGSCDETGVFACTGGAFLVLILGIPITYVVWSLGLRFVGVPMPWLAPVTVLAVVFVLVNVTTAIEPPQWVWPVVASVTCGLWARLFQGVVSPRQ